MSAGIPPAPQQGGEPTTMQKSRVMRVGVLLVALSFTAAACGSDDDASSDTDAPSDTEATDDSIVEESVPEGDAAPGGECGNATSDVVDGDLEGFSGTTP